MGTIRKLTDEGIRYQRIGQFEKAVEKYQAALALAKSLSPTSETTALIFSLLGAAYVSLGRWTEAVEASSQAIVLKPNAAEAHQMLGLAYSALGRYQEGIKAYEEAIRLKPDYTEAYFGLGLAYKKLGRYQQAIEALQKAIHANPDFVFAHMELGSIYVEMLENEGRQHEAAGQTDTAIEKYRIALEKCRATLETTKALHYDTGISYFSTLAAGLLTNLGILSSKQQLHEEAADYYRQAGQFNEGIGNVANAATLRIYANMQEGLAQLRTAHVYLQEGKDQEAIQAFGSVAGIFKQVGDVGLAAGALNYIAQIYEKRLGDNENALNYYLQALDLCRQKDPHLEAQISRSIGSLYVSMNQNEKALAFLKRAAELHEEANNFGPAFGALFALGNSYQKISQPDRALESFEKALHVSQKL